MATSISLNKMTFKNTLLLLGLLATSQSQAEHSQAVFSQNGAYQILIEDDFGAIEIGKFHELEIHLYGSDGRPLEAAKIAIDGGMLAHGHGLPTRPNILEIGSGRYLVRGLKLSMRGAWQLFFDVTVDGITEQILVELSI